MLLLQHYAGYWSLLVASAELLILTTQLCRLTGRRFFERWLGRFIWMLPLVLYLDYRFRGSMPRVLHIHSFEEYLFFQARDLSHGTEILAAIHIPYLTAAIIIVAAIPRMFRLVQNYLRLLLRN